MANIQDNLHNITGCQAAPISSNIHVVGGVQPAQQANQTGVFKFTDLNSVINSLNFPDKNSVNECFFQENFNRLLGLVRTKMVQANSTNNNFCRVLTADTASYKEIVVTSVKSFLTNKGYVITEIENHDGISTGWKLMW
jgi:hypothetical protein